ncbi:hypothetical protein QM480_05250 [Flectobacillus sp. DC10W]|uniref:Uncharacterized protein n=1 Tax=Flectobacillus longus TaxID=2984207 RepID=A0ABT6YJE9_9BACT|nr:hypothetical protein [Flectobacillus longus]MDI9863718.1 hypothetical protein [Flectobacillus longus]
MKLLLFTKILILLFLSVHIRAQSTVSVGITLNSVALLKLSPNSNSISFSFSTPATAGGALTTLTNNTKWLNFSSAVVPSASRRITAQISGGTVPNGLQLTVAAGTAVTSTGTVGSSSGTVTLSTSSNTIVNNIGGAYTGSGSNTGYNLTYTLSISSYQQLRSGTSSFSVTYTLVDN